MRSTFIQPSEVVCAAYFLCKVLYIWFFVKKIIPAMSTFNMLSTSSFSLEFFVVKVFYKTLECVLLLLSPEFKLAFLFKGPLYILPVYIL